MSTTAEVPLAAAGVEDGLGGEAAPPPPPPPARVCKVCGIGDDGRRLCHFLPTQDEPEEILLHVFCGKTAAILPHVNRPDLEILTKAGVKNKHGTGVSVTLALQRCRSAKVNDPSNREQEYFLSKEFERIYHAVTKEPSITAVAAAAVAAVPTIRTTAASSTTTTTTTTTATTSSVTTSPIATTDADPIGQLNLDDIHADIHHVPNPMYTTSASSTVVDHMPSEATVTPEQIPPPVSTSVYHDYTPEADEPPAKRFKEAVDDHDLLKSPYDLAMERLQAVCDRCHGVGYSLVRGVARATQDDDYEEAEEETFDPTKCSQAQVDHVRVIVITKERQECMDEMGRLILGEQFGAQLMSFSTSFSYHVLGAWSQFSKLYHQTMDWKRKFDLLLGFTDTLKEHDVWIHDHEVGWGGEKMVKQLALCWKTILTKTDEDLGIDREYTRPGIVALLEQFKEAVESVETYGVDEPMKFNF